MIKQAASPAWWKGKDESDTTIAYMWVSLWVQKKWIKGGRKKG